ncbi:hypothetical protein JCM3775_004362 [Rhodotorula graminis]
MADPAFRGFVESTFDALLIFEGCRRGFLPKITRRLQEFEKRQNVVSGAVFVFDEEETGIKRWTDGLSWSPSRTLGNFLVYRELDKKAQPPPGGAGAAAGADDEDGEGGGGTSGAAAGGSGGGSVRSRLMGGLTSKADPVDEQEMAGAGPVASGSGSRPGSSSGPRRSSVSELAGATLDRVRERALVGSLTSSYRFRSDGLVKKTISLQGLHLIGYYRIDDVVSGRLRTPSSHHELNALEVSSHFLTPSLYRIPPLVEIGPDGHLKYKGEADAPMSPLTRSGSSQGLPTPGGPHSRPPSASDASHHFGHSLPPVGGSWDHPLATPTSPRRSTHVNFRTNNRFDPYGSSTRFSPSNNYAPPPSNGGYPFPPVGAGQPAPRAAYTPMSESGYGAGGAYFQERTPPVDGTSSSAPHVSGGWHGPHGGGGGMYPPGSAVGEYAHHPVPSTSSFYQPRHSIPFAPTSDANSSGGIFAYNPPPAAGSHGPGAQQYRAPHTASGAYAAYHRPYSAQQPPHALAQAHVPPPNTAPSYGAQLSPTGTHTHSPFATPPSTGHVGRAPHPGTLNLSHTSSVPPSQSSSSLPSPVPPLGYSSSHGRTNGPIVEPTSSLASHAATLMAEVSPHSPADALGDSRMQRQQQQALRSLYATGDSANSGAYPAPPPAPSTTAAYSGYDPAARGSYGYQAPAPQAPQQHPSGLVAPGPNDEVVPASGHGLGVSPYGEIVSAASVGPRGGPSSYGLPPRPGLQGVAGAEGLGLSAQHAYAPPPTGSYDGRGMQSAVAAPPPASQQFGAQRDGRLEREGVERAPGAWAVKREPLDAHSQLHQPLSPPMQPQRSLGPHEQYRHHQQHQQQVPPQQHSQQQQQQQGWWAGGDDPWQQGVAQRQAQEFQQA